MTRGTVLGFLAWMAAAAWQWHYRGDLHAALSCAAWAQLWWLPSLSSAAKTIGQLRAAIVVSCTAVYVGVALGFLAQWLLALACLAEGIHYGWRCMMLPLGGSKRRFAVLTVVVLVAPPALGELVAWGVRAAL